MTDLFLTAIVEKGLLHLGWISVD